MGSNVLKNKFERDHIISAQSVTEVTIGFLSISFPLKIIIILKWTIRQQHLLAIGFIFVLYATKVFQKEKIPSQAVCNKSEVEVASKVLQNLRRLEKALILRTILFQKKAIMHGKGEFSKIKGNIWE